MRSIVSLAVALLIGLGIVAVVSNVLEQWSLVHYATQTDNY